MLGSDKACEGLRGPETKMDKEHLFRAARPAEGTMAKWELEGQRFRQRECLVQASRVVAQPALTTSCHA